MLEGKKIYVDIDIMKNFFDIISKKKEVKNHSIGLL